ncbi:MAG: hypothetical protein ACR2MS_06980 [Weeksellaceae bacterium]
MERNINKFLTISRNKKGKVNITHDLENEANIYKLLYNLGFRKGTLNNKKILFQKVQDDLIPVSIDDIRASFHDLLENFEFENVPDDVNYIDILDYNLVKQPVKQNKLFNHYLSVELTESDAHILRIKTDFKYKHRNEINSLLEKLEEWNFTKSIDEKSSICTNDPLYYKKIGPEKFIIFSHYNSESKNNTDGFDCWIAVFKSEKQIGATLPSELYDIKLSFNLERDFELIKDYVV